MAEPNCSAINPFGAKVIVRTSGVVIAELGSAGWTDSEVHRRFYHPVVCANGAVIRHGVSPATAVHKIRDVRAETMSAGVRHEKSQNSIIRRNRAKSISDWAESKPATVPTRAFVYTYWLCRAQELVCGIFVVLFGVELWIKLHAMALVVLGALIGGVESERVNRSHVEILPSYLAVSLREAPCAIRL